ncbi:hypothetical protein JHK82_033741 [Glycine max]|nr:hypothetical protein JHK85_034457 [Glycine max]KAG5119321.1 hypothetical protein JHK82_033741 [Glycine max]KAG5140315.1 hypothetical protein JHK84_034083 [Glycine max]
MRGPEVSFGANVIASNATDDGVNVASSNPDEEVDIFEHIRQKDEATEKGKKCRKIKKREAKRVRITCLKQMGNMKEYPLVDLSLFTWVFGEVDTYTSIFLTTKFIIDLKERVKLTYDNNSDWVVVDHCLPSERVYLNTHKGQPNFIYLRDIVIIDKFLRRMNIKEVLDFPYSGDIEGSLTSGKGDRPKDKVAKMTKVIHLVDFDKVKGPKEKTLKKQTSLRSDAKKITTEGCGAIDSFLRKQIPSKPNIEKTTTNGGDVVDLGSSTNVEKLTSTPTTLTLKTAVPLPKGKIGPLHHLDHVTSLDHVSSLWHSNAKALSLIRHLRLKFVDVEVRLKLSAKERKKMINALNGKNPTTTAKLGIIKILQQKIIDHEKLISAKSVENEKLFPDMENLNKKFNEAMKDLVESRKTTTTLNNQLLIKEKKG